MKGIFAAAALAALATASGSAIAAPSASAPATGQGLVSKVATFVCVRDDRGWHYMRGKSRVSCRPVRPKGNMWAWHCEGKRCGWWHNKEHRWND